MCQHPPAPSVGWDAADPAAPGASAVGAPSHTTAPARPPVPHGALPMAPGPVRSGSRRRRLWDLDPHAHCPLLGVCLPLAALRRLVSQVSGQPSTAPDHDLHSSVVGECRRRTPLSEALQKHLDQRYALALQQAAKVKTSEALARWWAEASAGHALPAAFWAVLTHPACDVPLEHAVLGQVHMLQHQVGLATRAELARFEALIDENAVLARALAVAQQRSQRQAADAAARVAQLEADLVRQRGATLARDTQLAQLQALVADLEAASPGLRERHRLAQENQALRGQMQDLQRALAAAREAACQAQLRCERLEAQHAGLQAQTPPQAGVTAPPPHRPLVDQAVLCVGGRQASVPLYRLVIERTGGRFLHHDGGEQDSPHKLDATLAAADLVICQTGCVSHDAYWRVKDHCKRTGKRCLFVDTPSRAALERALAQAVAKAAVAEQPLAQVPHPPAHPSP